MANQLLATFYVQSPEFLYGNVTVTAQVQYQSGNNWYQNTSELTATVTPAHYNDPANGNQQRYRYKVDVFRVEQWQWNSSIQQDVYYYPLYKAGTYRRRLRVTVNNSFTLDRMIYLTIQPNVHVYREAAGTQIDLAHTAETVISQNPLQKQVVVNVSDTPEALAARNIAITEPNDYKGTVFVKSNLPVNAYSDDLSLENSNDNYYSDTWLRLQNLIRMTRKIGSSEYKWNDGYGSYPIIKTDAQGKYAYFIVDNNDDNNSPLLDYPYYGAVACGFEKPVLEMPLAVESDIQIQGRGVLRYTGTGETTTTTTPVVLPLRVVLKTTHVKDTICTLITENHLSVGDVKMLLHEIIGHIDRYSYASTVAWEF